MAQTVKKQYRFFIPLVSFVAALGGLLFGLDTAVISGAIPYITPYFKLDANMLGWAVSCILIGCAAGAAFAGRLADLWGRRAVLIVCSLLFAVSGIGAGLSDQLHLFIFFRILGGLGVGAAALVSPMYIAEIAPAHKRGRLVAFYQLAIVTGILLAYFSNYLFAGWGDNNWRWMFGIQALPAALFGLLLLCVPETPRWLISRGKTAEAASILEKITAPHYIQAEITAIEASFRNVKRVSPATLFSKKYAGVVCIGIMIAIFQQVTGINSILYYAPVIFKETGLDNSSSLFHTIGIGLVNVIATFIAIGVVDTVGRKKLLLGGSIVMGLSLIAIAACFHYRYFENYIVLIGVLLYVAAFGCTLGTVTWVYLSEIFPNSIRGLALSAATLSLWIADFIVTYTFPLMTQGLGTPNTLFCYAALCFLAFFYILFRTKETRGRTLEEIELLFIK